jgi:hypothetical protein
LKIVNGAFLLTAEVSKQQESGKVAAFDGNDHLYGDPEYSWDAYIHA